MEARRNGESGKATASEGALSRARAGDEEAFQILVEPYHRVLLLHCYRILGSLEDAEDALQETLLAAWRGLGRFEGRSSLRNWLYRTATNRCLNALRSRGRRPQERSMLIEPPEPTRRVKPVWLEPYPDALLDEIGDIAPGPEARYEAKESIQLAFVAALQHVPPRQRVALVLCDVLGFRRAEAADMLDSSEVSIKAALQRARKTLDKHIPTSSLEAAPLPDSARERELVGRFAVAVERGDVEGVVSVLTDDAWVTMPPEPHEYHGRAAIASFLRDREERRGVPVRLVPTRANGQPAFGCYLPDSQAPIARAYAMIALTLTEEGISVITWFGERSLFSRFGLPRTLPL